MEGLIYFLFWAGLFLLMMRIGCGAHVMGKHKHKTAEGDAEPGEAPVRWVPPETDVDPVCGKTVRTDSAKSSVHDGSVYFFCSRDCREQFEAAPDSYVGTRHPAFDGTRESTHG